MRKLFYGDNLEILRERVAADSVDLVYLDPPFNSNRAYHLLFETPAGRPGGGRVTAFADGAAPGQRAVGVGFSPSPAVAESGLSEGSTGFGNPCCSRSSAALS